jgi:hypothetical protein
MNWTAAGPFDKNWWAAPSVNKAAQLMHPAIFQADFCGLIGLIAAVCR